MNTYSFRSSSFEVIKDSWNQFQNMKYLPVYCLRQSLLYHSTSTDTPTIAVQNIINIGAEGSEFCAVIQTLLTDRHFFKLLGRLVVEILLRRNSETKWVDSYTYNI